MNMSCIPIESSLYIPILDFELRVRCYAGCDAPNVGQTFADPGPELGEC